MLPHRKSKEAGAIAPSPEEAPCGDFEAAYRFVVLTTSAHQLTTSTTPEAPFFVSYHYICPIRYHLSSTKIAGCYPIRLPLPPHLSPIQFTYVRVATLHVVQVGQKLYDLFLSASLIAFVDVGILRDTLQISHLPVTSRAPLPPGHDWRTEYCWSRGCRLSAHILTPRAPVIPTLRLYSLAVRSERRHRQDFAEAIMIATQNKVCH